MGKCRDLIHLLCSHLELFRAANAKIEKQQTRFLSIEERDKELKGVLSSENKLHPSLFSAEAEHKVSSFILTHQTVHHHSRWMLSAGPGFVVHSYIFRFEVL